MFTIKNYVLAESLEQAYELNQNKANSVLGGIMWLKIGGRDIETAIDLSGLGLNKIEEAEDYFRIGCMATLRDMEVHPGLLNCFGSYLPTALGHIVGVQFRNGATVGGTVNSRFAFSDVLTALLALDTGVELHKGGLVPLTRFLDMQPDRDIVVSITIQKKRNQAVYLSERMSATDLPIINCAVSNDSGHWKIVLGARPGRAKLTDFTLTGKPAKQDIEQWTKQVFDTLEFGGNTRGSKEYREHLAGILVRRGIASVVEGGSYAD